VRRVGTPAVLALLAVVGTLAGCGLPIDGSPRAIPKGEVPPVLSARNSAATTSTTTFPVGNAVPVQLWFVDSGLRLTFIDRLVHKPATLQSVLNVLEAGPRGVAEVKRRRLRSYIPADAGLEALGVDRGVATVEFGPPFSGIPTTQSNYAFGQIVYSLTHIPGVHGVLFDFAGSPSPAEIGSGAIVNRPVTRHDYRQLIAR
jgi:spore germination protein GerM